MNKYEFAVLYHPDLEVDLTKAEEKVKKIIAASEGKVIATDNWGKRKTAYAINGHDYAVYVFYTVEMPAAGVAKAEQALNITDEVIRFLITRPDEKAAAKADAYKAKRKVQADSEESSEDAKEE